MGTGTLAIGRRIGACPPVSLSATHGWGAAGGRMEGSRPRAQHGSGCAADSGNAVPGEHGDGTPAGQDPRREARPLRVGGAFSSAGPVALPAVQGRQTRGQAPATSPWNRCLSPSRSQRLIVGRRAAGGRTEGSRPRAQHGSETAADSWNAVPGEHGDGTPAGQDPRREARPPRRRHRQPGPRPRRLGLGTGTSTAGPRFSLAAAS